VIQELLSHDASIGMVVSYAEKAHRPGSHSDDFYESIGKVRVKLSERFSQPMLKSKLYAFGLKISEHRSSMLQDAEAGRKTEIRDFNGWVIDMAHFLGTDLDVSIHRDLIGLVERCEVLDKTHLARFLLK
jgi:2-dehydropantoate 2-reductase